MAAQPLPFPPGDDDDAGLGIAAVAPAPTGAPLARLLDVCALVRELASLDWSEQVGSSAKVALKALEGLSRSTTAIQAGVLAAAQSSGTWARDGQRTFDSWVTSQTGTTRRAAGQAVKLSKSLHEDLPATRKALADGEISSDHARIISQRCATTTKQRERLADPTDGESYLVKRAKEMDAGQFSKLARAWAIKTDPKTADRNFRRETATQEFSLTPTEDGFIASGTFTHVDGSLIKEAIGSHMGRKSKNDLRTFNERQGAALVSLAAQSLDSGLQMPGARIRPHLIVTMEYDTIERLIEASGPIVPDTFSGADPDDQCLTGADPALRDEAEWVHSWQPGDDHVISTELDYEILEGAAPARLAGGQPLPPKALARLACNSMFTRVVFGPDSVILDAGREERIFTAGQTRAIIARDQTCRYPGCDEGPGFGEIHHSLSWAKHNGQTDVEQGLLLCYYHHDLVHQRDIAITRRAGEWIFTSRTGHQILPPGHQFDAESDLAPPGSPPEPAADQGPAGARGPAWQQPGFDSEGPPPF